MAKATTKRATKKKAAPRKKAATRKSATKKAAAQKPPTKSQIFADIAEQTGLTRRDVAAVFDALAEEIRQSIAKRGGPGQFAIPGLCKIVVQRKPASKARKGINPFTGEPTVFKAKPARNVVKIRPLKNLKDMVAKK